MSKGKGRTRIAQDISGIAYVAITTDQYAAVGDLALGTLAGPAVIVVS